MELAAGTPLGKGTRHAAGAVTDSELVQSLQAYRRRVVGAYRSIRPGEMATAVFGSPFHVSPKVDGELWFLVLEPGAATLVSNHGKALSGDIPFLAEAKSITAGKVSERIVIAGELFAASAGKGRPRVGDVASALSGGAEAAVERLGFVAFDLVDGYLPAAAQTAPYAARLEALTGLLGAGKRTRVIRTDTVEAASELPALFTELVEGGKAEGLVVRSAQGAIYKVKPEFTIDAVVMGYTARSEDPLAARTLLLGLTREDGSTQILGACGNLGGDAERRALMALLKPLDSPSSFRHPSSSGDLYTFTRPQIVVEICCTDLQPVSGDGKPILTMVLEHADATGWSAITSMPSASLLHPVLQRIREDKSSGVTDTRFAQLLERCVVEQAAGSATAVELPKSEVVRREVWTKSAKGSVAVRKLVAWKTNKEELDPSYPAYVVHWTDYSATRGTPLDREVRVAPTVELAEDIIARLIQDNIKKGWEKVG